VGVDFIGQYLIDASICERLVEFHRACDRQGLVNRGKVNREGKAIVDPSSKDSLDVRVGEVPAELQEQHGISLYVRELQRCAGEYIEEYPVLRGVAAFRVTESPLIQHYRPGGGFKTEHFERTNLATSSRALVWMTYLNDVTDGGGTRFVYQDKTFDARKGHTLIWPTDFTHTHVGVVSPTQHKYIITGWFNFVA
jgi:prolyl 4-hydroxylase